MPIRTKSLAAKVSEEQFQHGDGFLLLTCFRKSRLLNRRFPLLARGIHYPIVRPSQSP
jgi:hypothetical protein